MYKIVIVTNIPAPYRVDLFYYMQTHIKEYEFHVIYTNDTEDNRNWTIDNGKLLNSHVLQSKIIKRKKDCDTEYIHLTTGLMSELKKISPDIVIAFEYNPAAMQSLLWCKMHGKKFIHLTDGTLHSERDIRKMQKLSRKVILHYADSYIASSTKAKEKLLAWGVAQEKVSISFLTVDIAPYERLKHNKVKGRILYVGSMIKRKGLDLLINALPFIQTDYILHVVGSGTEEDISYLKQIAKENNVSNNIIWHGYKEKDALFREYSQASAFVLPTREDCFGLVLLEAMFAGLPIVASKYADGAYDIVENGRNGYIVDPYKPKELADALTNVLLNQQMKMQAEAGNNTAFHFENVITGYLNAIRHCQLHE